MKKKLIKALSSLPNDKALDLGDDTFLIGELDGSDKCYGFGRTGDELLVFTRSSMSGFPINDMDEDDLNYIMNLSGIYGKICAGEYNIVDFDEMCW